MRFFGQTAVMHVLTGHQHSPSHLLCEALTWAAPTPSYRVAPNFQALHYLRDLFPALKFDQNQPMSSIASAEELTDGQTDGMHKRDHIQEFCNPLHHLLPTTSFA